ncbi:MAG: hypothetical protein WD992_03360 [Candidatus Levyibacteriota bacterium]
MGKVRIKTFGDQEQEQKEKEQRKIEREQKKIARETEVSVNGEKDQNVSEAITSEQKVDEETPKKEKKSQNKKTVARIRSKSYTEKASLVDKKNKYQIPDALELLEKMKQFSAKGGPASGWDETVELHINTTRTGQFGTLTLPHGTGKQVKVAIADDALIAEIEKGKINFDILLAEPEMMPKLAKVARVLGPRGLMPNPKNGTISKNPAEAAKEFEKGQMTIKTEGKFPVLHLTVGKVSFGKEKLAKNIEAVLDTVKAANIKSLTVKSTMSPGVKINVA